MGLHRSRFASPKGEQYCLDETGKDSFLKKVREKSRKPEKPRKSVKNLLTHVGAYNIIFYCDMFKNVLPQPRQGHFK